MAMEFWGVEVKAGQPLKVQPEFGRLIHISQAAMGEAKDAKAAKYIPLKLKVDYKDFIIGSLAAEERPQLMFDLVFEKEFELSHDWKNGSVYFLGYTADDQEDEGEYSEFDDEFEDEPVDIPETETVPAMSGDVKGAKPPAAAIKPGAEQEEQPVSDEDDIEASLSDDEGAMDLSGGDDEDSDESLSSEEEELPKVQESKKRPAEPVQKTPVPVNKKAKAATPDKTGNKKGQASTPFPSKGAGKSPAGNKSSGQGGPKSSGFKGKRGGK